jgi:hypothetical protein
MTPTNCPVIRLPPVEMPDLSRGNCVGRRSEFEAADRALGEEYGGGGGGVNDGAVDVLHAKSICQGCEPRAECLVYAVLNREWGVWAATTRHEREQIRKKMR